MKITSRLVFLFGLAAVNASLLTGCPDKSEDKAPPAASAAAPAAPAAVAPKPAASAKGGW